MAQKNILICAPVSAGGPVISGTVKLACSECGALVYVSPGSLIILHDIPGVEAVCILCAVDLLPKARMIRTHAPSPAQFDDIKEYLEAEG